jgi:hypothetical protein
MLTDEQLQMTKIMMPPEIEKFEKEMKESNKNHLDKIV